MRIVMMGTGTFAEPTLEALLRSAHEVVGVVTQPDRPTGEKRGSTRQTGRGMKEIALEQGIPVLQPDSINTPEGIRALTELRPELLVVAAYGQILAHDVLLAAPLGGINVHASLLPKYRGAAPIAWAIYHGETHTGVSIIRMSVSLDAGDVLAQETTAIGPDETAGEVEARLGPLGARLAVEIADRLALGPVVGTKQDKALVTKAPKLTKENGIVDWTRPAAAVCNQIRAMQPWPTAYTFLHEEGRPPIRLLLQRVRPSDASIPVGPTAGSAASDGTRWWVRCGDGGTVEILELQPSGKKRMAAGDFLRGHPLPPDARLAPETPPPPP